MLFKEKVISKIAEKEGVEVRKLLENLLQENVQLRQAINAIPSAIFVIDADTSLRYTNTIGKKFLNRENRYYGRPLLKNMRSQEIANTLEGLLHPLPTRPEWRDISLFYRVPKDFLIGIFPIAEGPFAEANEQPPTEEPPAQKSAQKNSQKSAHMRNTQSPQQGKGDKTNSPIKEAPSKYLLTISDMSELKLRYMEESQKNSINSLTMLTSGIAHEIKNPLSALDLHIQLILRTLKASQFPQRAEIEDLFSVVNHEIRRLDSILNDFLQSFRPRRAIKKPTDLNAIVNLTLSLLKAKLDDDAVEVRLALDPKIKPFPLDENLIEQLLLNLLENSLEAIAEKVQPEEKRISISTHASSLDTLKLQIEDTGIGMHEEALTKIFHPFHTSKKTGTGLGLSIVTRILQEHNGVIFVESKEGMGTSITIEFHRHPKKPLLLSDTPPL